ncbi:hypothetical protein [Zhongshania borealis]|uniref:MMPL family transporter n=1 Tax=Zhongshania borealis TaxID=889488 RepID=A0ABP7WI63_9GAMM
MSKLTNAIKQKFAFAVWLSVLLTAALYCTSKIQRGDAFETNILGLLPASVTEDVQSELNKKSGFDRKFAILISADIDSDALAAAASLGTQLNTLNNVSIDQHDGDQVTALRNFYRPYLHQLLSPDWRHRLQQSTPLEIANIAYRELFNPVAKFRPYSMAIDPFNLGGDWFAYILPQQNRFRASDLPSVKNGDNIWYIVSGELTGSPFSPVVQTPISSTLAQFSEKHSELRILRSGLVFHAAEATALSSREISTVGLGSLLAIVFLVVTVFRSGPALLAIALTMSASVLGGLACCLLIFDRVHLITIAFGSTLLGLAVDYCFHFLIKYRQVADAPLAGRLLARGLLFSAASSIFAYVFQLLSPLAGLQQFAVFMCAGLAAAALNIIVLSQYFREAPSPSFNRWLNIYPQYVAPIYRRLSLPYKTISVSLFVLTVALSTLLLNRENSDDIRDLNSSSMALMASEAKVQNLLGIAGTQRYLRITASNEQERLEQSLNIANQFDTLRPSQPLPASHVLGRLIPPDAQQRADFELLRDKLYGKQGAIYELCQLLNNDCSTWQGLAASFQPDLRPSSLPADLRPLFPASLFSTSKETRILINLDNDTAVALEDLLANNPKISYVDKVAQLSTSLQLFRHNTSIALAVFLLAFTVAMFIIYRTRALAPLITLGIVIAVSLVCATGAGISLFHILALLLVIGLAVDTSVFYLELGLTAETWLASTLSAITSVLAFGLLALSEVPVLHQFGSVVFAGLLCSWLLSPLIFHLFRLTPTNELAVRPISTNKDMLS